MFLRDLNSPQAEVIRRKQTAEERRHTGCSLNSPPQEPNSTHIAAAAPSSDGVPIPYHHPHPMMLSPSCSTARCFAQPPAAAHSFGRMEIFFFSLQIALFPRLKLYREQSIFYCYFFLEFKKPQTFFTERLWFSCSEINFGTKLGSHAQIEGCWL